MRIWHATIHKKGTQHDLNLNNYRTFVDHEITLFLLFFDGGFISPLIGNKIKFGAFIRISDKSGRCLDIWHTNKIELFGLSMKQCEINMKAHSNIFKERDLKKRFRGKRHIEMVIMFMFWSLLDSYGHLVSFKPFQWI